ncbi:MULTISPECIES: Spx/MgsR family RNA polymerase-binding regulatory protein [unclassified Gemella]|uniref:Spx/MgsR family RNA polymerase-binding regulatory protein n=1 Tax=unclassified Gemella TaxID=2624949 RepID=UPI001073B897|nr:MULTISPECIES: Spx/MgsR family RNA polymerase-binding regulatory protein [unclassified Gemella]MBF0709898.1 Spx/MgsR family RNA polymerase-binding regulatory protein [Gemella sp. GL1.1]MBF0746798.1 Spx/MgsR family RNA polymerase-binding regulatory protein [Gemella sp. 19428wG2_WT2a]NYS27242.1 Spx/MgsR family RNA polymerase-binding regulatory protein [Gemella sp. GL1]TFU59523.1 Spx/MgsR family RNA polymerase-binding regulatory protein [Gemella sp. WT2a]
MKIYEYPKCSTCRSAKKFINANNIKADFVDIKSSCPSKEDINTILDTFNVELKSLFNTSGNMYRELGLKDKLPTLSQDEQIKILLSDGMLIKRPLAYDFNKKIFLQGFKENIWKETLVKEN